MSKPTSAPIRKQVSLSAEIAEAIDDYRFSNKIKSEAETMRIIIEAGMKALNIQIK